MKSSRDILKEVEQQKEASHWLYYAMTTLDKKEPCEAYRHALKLHHFALAKVREEAENKSSEKQIEFDFVKYIR